MGLAASQARLLTLTSRLSSIELRQQAIANSKILLANDSEEVSNKYTKALNNQTLKMSDGTNEIPMTYDALKSFGYDVRRTGDGVVASSAQSSGAKPNQNTNVKKSSTITDPEILKWVGKPAPTAPSLPTAPVEPQKPSFSRPLATPPTRESVQPASYPTEQFNDARRALSSTFDTFRQSYIPLVNALRPFGQASMYLASGFQEAAGINARGGDWVSVMSNAINTAEDKAKTAQKEMVNSSPSYEQIYKNWENKTNEWKKYDNQYAQYTREKAQYDKDQEQYEFKYDTYLKDLKNWTLANSGKVDTQDGTSSVGGAGGAGASGSASGSSSNPQAQALAQQLKSNPQFLIQGLLSGYLTLVKDGQDVSISSATNILEQYDKSDDAAAEAEYNAQMAKINRKEKILDQQMKNLDTEHSAMQQEVESIKSIIKDHADKDFNLFG